MNEILKALQPEQKRNILLLVDLLIVPMALVGALLLHTGPSYSFQALFLGGAYLPLLVTGTFFLSLHFGVARIRLDGFEMRAVSKTATFAALVALLSLALSFGLGAGTSFGFHVSFGINFFALNIASRMAMRRVRNSAARLDRPARRVLIYGAGRTGMQLACALQGDRSVNVVAFVDDNRALEGSMVAGVQVVGSRRVEALVAKRGIELVYLAMPTISSEKSSQISSRLRRLGVKVRSLSSFEQVLIGGGSEKTGPVPAAAAFLGRELQQNRPNTGNDEYQGRSILISGAGGSIGSELCRQIMSHSPARIVLFEMGEYALFSIERELSALARDAGVEIIPVLGSVANPALVSDIFSQYAIDVVLHAAAYKHLTLVEQNPLVGVENNVLATATLAQMSVAAGVRKFVLVSSDKAVRPTSTMGATKRFAEMLVQDIGSRARQTEFSIVRFGNVFGSSGSVVPIFQEQIAAGGPVTVTDKNATRYFMTMEEAAQLVLLAGSFAEGGEVFVLNMGEPVRVFDLARQMIESAGYTLRNSSNPDGDIEIAFTGLRKGEKLHEDLLISEADIHTAHPKIFRVREAVPSEVEVAATLRSLREAVAAVDPAAAVSALNARIENQEVATAKLWTA